MEKFDELEVTPRLKLNLAQAGFSVPTPVQAGALPPALLGRDVLATAQTGTGKTLAFMVPIIQRLSTSHGRGIEALVLVPTRELAMQVYETFEKLSQGLTVNGALVVGGLSEHLQMQAIRRGARLVVATPGRLDDFIKRRMVDLSGVTLLVIDEADRMADMGFLPQMKAILRELPPRRQSMCFSATLGSEVSHLVQQYLASPVRVEIGSVTKHAETVTLRLYEVLRENKLRLLLRLLEIEQGTVLIFVRTKHGADKVARKLIQSGINASVIHGNRSQSQRTSALKGFQSGKYRVMVATDIAARGIHIDDIAHVINFDLPQVPEDFIHRVGRTGRAEKTGTASTFVTPDQAGDVNRIEKLLRVRIERMPMPAGLPAELPRMEGTAPKLKSDDNHPLAALWAEQKQFSRSRPRRPRTYRHGRSDGPPRQSFRGASRRSRY